MGGVEERAGVVDLEVGVNFGFGTLRSGCYLQIITRRLQPGQIVFAGK